MERQGKGEQRTVFTHGPRGPFPHRDSGKTEAELTWIIMLLYFTKVQACAGGKGQEGVVYGEGLLCKDCACDCLRVPGPATAVPAPRDLRTVPHPFQAFHTCPRVRRKVNSKRGPFSSPLSSAVGEIEWRSGRAVR